MEQLTYLSEKDLEYFEKLEEKGEAVIIRIDPTVLVKLNIDELEEIDTEKEPLTGEQLQVWLEKNNALILQKQESKAADEQKRKILEKAKEEGFSESEIELLKQNSRDENDLADAFEFVKKYRKELERNGI